MRVDVIVVGGGLAGAILAWTLRVRGASVVVFDDQGLSRCSRVAAGLYHPVTGRRLALTWRARTLLETGRKLFQTLGEHAGHPVFHPLPIRRSFSDPAMVETWSQRRDEVRRAGLVFKVFDEEAEGPIRSDHGGYELDGCGYVDTESLIAAVADPMGAQNRWIEQAVTSDEVRIHSDGVHCHGVVADQVVFAQGHLGRLNPLWQHLPFRPLQGEILDLRIDGHLSSCIHLGKIFLVPRGQGLWQAGATYDRTIDRDEPTAKGRRMLEEELNAFLRLPYTVVGHRGGVRPASGDTMPFIGRHSTEPKAWIFNGFGSRSLLLAPHCAELLAGALIDGSALPAEIDVARFQPKRPRARPFRATSTAWDRIAEVLRPGDLATDATVGNGHDTIWLAERVGPEGRVLACDIQERAIETTRERLAKTGLTSRVVLIRGDHGELPSILPDDWSGRVRAVLYNLGKLPGGDPSVRTRPETTLKSFEASLGILEPGGRMTAIVNPVDPSGNEEDHAIRDWMTGLSDTRFQVEVMRGPKPSKRDPWVLVVTVR